MIEEKKGEEFPLFLLPLFTGPSTRPFFPAGRSGPPGSFVLEEQPDGWPSRVLPSAGLPVAPPQLSGLGGTNSALYQQVVARLPLAAAAPPECTGANRAGSLGEVGADQTRGRRRVGSSGWPPPFLPTNSGGYRCLWVAGSTGYFRRGCSGPTTDNLGPRLVPNSGYHTKVSHSRTSQSLTKLHTDNLLTTPHPEDNQRDTQSLMHASRPPLIPSHGSHGRQLSLPSSRPSFTTSRSLSTKPHRNPNRQCLSAAWYRAAANS